jgi:hypothetical protein
MTQVWTKKHLIIAYILYVLCQPSHIISETSDC